jgi:hypothetical protein
MHKLFREEFVQDGKDANGAAASALRRLSGDPEPSAAQPVSQNGGSHCDEERKQVLDNLRKAFLEEIKGLSEDGDANAAVAELLLQIGKQISVEKSSEGLSSLQETSEGTGNEEQVGPETSLPPRPPPPNCPAFAPTPRSRTRVGPMLPSSDSNDARSVCAGIPAEVVESAA